MESLSNIIGNRTVGVVGIGKWGKHFVQTLSPHSSHPILQSDPMRAEAEPDFPHVPLIELTERADILILSAPLDAIREVLLEMREKLRQGQIIIDIASSKRSIVDLLQGIDKDGRAIVGSIHPMAGAPPNPPSLRGQNGIICTISNRSKEAEAVGEAFFADQEMIIHRMQVQEHDRLMDVIQGLPHAFQLGACVAMGNSLSDSLTIHDVEKFGSANFELFMLAVGRPVSSVEATLQADLITSMVSSPAGEHMLEQAIASMQRILEMAKHDRHRPKEERTLPAWIEQARKKLDPEGKWREEMNAKTNTIIIRLANIRKKSLHLTTREDHIGLLEEICAILRHHSIDLNAIDSLPSKRFPGGMEFELGCKDEAPVNIVQLRQDLEAIGVLLIEIGR